MSRFASQMNEPPAPAAPTPSQHIESPANGNGRAVVSPTRIGKKSLNAYVSPEMAFAMHMEARRNDITLNAAMIEAFDLWLRSKGAHPVGA